MTGPRGSSDPEVLVVGSPTNRTNVALVAHWHARGRRASLVTFRDVERAAGSESVVIGRLDVLPGLDGVEPGLLTLLRLERRGIAVLNRAAALLAAHDKLLTARRLTGAGLPHPATIGWHGSGLPPLPPPVVVKPRFGSWGRDVFRCDDRDALERCIAVIRGRTWFRRHGAVVQALVPPRGCDLRLVVAGGRVVGAAERIAAAGEWRTNVSLGGSLRPSEPSREARSLACAAAAAIGADLVGVDLLLGDDGRLVVLELNGAVDFDERYSLDGGDVYADVAESLGLPGAAPVELVSAARPERRR